MREFDSGAIRDTSNGKHEYMGFMHPLIDKSFAEYMHSHRTMADGSLRDSNNWWGGFGKEACIQSLLRHVEDLKALHIGYEVYEERVGEEVLKHYVNPLDGEDYLTQVISTDNLHQITEEECLNAIRFNSGAYMLEELGISKNT